MRVLFYGGCHAVALRTLFQHSAIGKHQFTSLQNFELINSGTPFPFDQLPQYDAVAYSPVRNKGEWNTDILRERCAALGVRTVSFPWLQWNGYFPDVANSNHAPHLWAYQKLVHIAKEGASVADLRVVAVDPAGLDPLGYVEYAFRALEEHESDVEVKIGDFIRKNYRSSRLFFTPNHPTLALYTYVRAQIAKRLGIWLNGFGTRPDEQHTDALPILPGVRDALNLGFDGDGYRLEGWAQPLDLDAFLALTVELESQALAAPAAG